MIASPIWPGKNPCLSQCPPMLVAAILWDLYLKCARHHEVDAARVKIYALHIYGKTQLLNGTFRPHVFINELELYINYIKREFEKSRSNLTEKRKSYFSSFKSNLLEGIKFYEKYFTPLLFMNDTIFQKNILLLEENKISIQKIFQSLDK